jgi:hypothetical protein
MALALLLPLPFALYYGDGGTQALLISSAINAVIGGLLILFTKNPKKELRAKEGFLTVTLGWILFSAFGALPFVLSGAIPSYTDADFKNDYDYYQNNSRVLFSGKNGVLLSYNYTTDKWTEFETNTNGTISDVEFVNDSTWLYTDTDNGLVQKTSDYGNTWVTTYQIEQPTNITRTVNSFTDLILEYNILAISTNKKGIAIVSKDGANTWEFIDISEYLVEGDDGIITACFYANDYSGYIGTKAGNIYQGEGHQNTIWRCTYQLEKEEDTDKEYTIWDFEIEDLSMLVSTPSKFIAHTGFAVGSNHSYIKHASTSIEDEQFNLILNPNITSRGNLIQLSDTPLTVRKIEIYSVEGRLISSKEYKPFFNAPKYPGMYFVNITFGDGSIATEKLLVK